MKLRLLIIIGLVSLALLASFSVVVAQERNSQGGAASASGSGAPASPPAAVGSGFTYQGQLKNSSNPVNGTCDFQFSLYDAVSGGTQVGTTQTILAVSVANGVFTVLLNDSDQFGSAFTGEERYLAIDVRCPAGSGSYTSLTPRQQLSAAPYAFSLKPEATISATITGTLANPDGGVLKVNNTAPDIYAYNSGLRASSGTDSTDQFSDGAGVYGRGAIEGVLGTGNWFGTGGVSQTDSGWGLFGRADGLHGAGLFAMATSKSGYGIYAINYSEVITGGFGIYGVKGSLSGYDLLAHYWYPAAVVGDTDAGNGVIGVSSSLNGHGVMGITAGSASDGVVGVATSTDVDGNGVSGCSYGTHGIGVYGYTSGTASFGVYGFTASTTAIGVAGLQTGYSTSGLGTYWSPGGFFGGKNGVIGITSEAAGYGILGWSSSTNGGAGVFGRADSTNVAGVYGTNTASGYAGFFSGNVYVTGNLGAGGTKPFRIDYPLDPANKYLYHYAVESPQVQNQYNGTVTLDASGEAVVDLPVYFSSVNKGPFQYQLTAIGAPGPNLYIAEEVTGNQFKIAGGTPGTKVSWLLYGLRNDPWIQDNPQVDVADKPAGEAGKYVYPQGYGQPASLQIGSMEQENPNNSLQTPAVPEVQNPGAAGTTSAPQQPEAVPGSSTYPPQP